MAVAAGRMDERITIEQPSADRNQLGEATIEWSAMKTVWASVDGLSSREILQAMQANVVASHRIRIRYLDSVTPHCRIVWRGRTMEIASLVERNKRTVLEILVREVM